MDLGDSGAREFSVSLESKVRNKQAHQFFSSVSLVSCKWRLNEIQSQLMGHDVFSFLHNRAESLVTMVISFSL